MQQRFGIMGRAKRAKRTFKELSSAKRFCESFDLSSPPSPPMVAKNIYVQLPDERMVKLTKETEQLKYFWYFMVAQFLRLG